MFKTFVSFLSGYASYITANESLHRPLTHTIISVKVQYKKKRDD